MKKLTALLLAAAMCLSLAACGKPAQQTQQTDDTTAVSDSLRRSVYDETNGSFTNSYTQLTVTPPGDWYIYSDSDLAAAYLGGAVTGDELSMWGLSDFKNKQLVPDFAFQDMANSNNFSVVYINLDKLENGAYTDKGEFHSLVIDNMNSQGKVLNQTDDEIITLCGKEFYLFEFKGKDAGWYIAMRRQDDTMIVVTATDRSGAGKEMFLGFIG